MKPQNIFKTWKIFQNTLAILSVNRARIYKRFRSPGIDPKESIPRVYVAWLAGAKPLYRLAESIPAP